MEKSMKILATVFASILMFGLSLNLYAEPNDPSIEIISPKDGEKVPKKFKVMFAAHNVAIVPAGTNQENSGHHHLIINGELPDLTKPLGSNVMHFGKGQTETDLELPVGVHTLQLVLGDKAHKPHQPAIISKKITIKVSD